MTCYIERSTTCGCHLINQPLSSSVLRIDPFFGFPVLLTHARWCIQQTSSVGRRDFSPKTLGLLHVLYLHRTSPEAYDMVLLFRLFNIFKDWLDCSYVEGLLVPFPRHIHQSGMSPGFSLCTKPLLSLLVSQHFAFQQYVLSRSSSETLVDTF